MASGADQRIKVGIRVRKLTRKEKDKNKQLQWKYSDNQLWQIDQQTGKKTGNPFTFDYVFGMDSSSQNIFDDLVKPIVESSIKGFNGTIFAYGQTSSGKTYTMIGEKSEEGIIPLSVSHVFNTTEKDADREYLIRVSYMEIYNEKIHDLLEYQNNLKIHEDASGNAYVMLKEEIVDCPEKVMGVMKKGEKMRRFGVTDINERSSRSHTIFRITIESRRKQTDMVSSETYWDDAVHVSHLNLIDLAGSERVFQTKATGDRFKEGCAINKSLFHLGKVISQLSEGRGQYVNFRDSKLTRILESSLGGNAHTAIICTVTPASVEETASTLCFASRAIRVTNTPHLNEIVSDECLLRRHAAEVKKLEMELEKAKQDNDCESMKKELEQKEKIICRLKDWIKRDELQVYSPRIVSRSERRKTWAASDLATSLLRAKSIQQEDLTTLNEEEFGSGSMAVDSPTFENVFECEKSDFVRRDRGSIGLWNKENHPLQHVRLSWQSPVIKSCGKEPRRGSQGGGKKRKSAMGDFPCSEDMSLQLLDKDHRIRTLESIVEELKSKLDGTVKEKELDSNEQLSHVKKGHLVEGNEPCSDIQFRTMGDKIDVSQNVEDDLRSKVLSLEASLEEEKLKVAALEESLEREKLKIGTLESSLEKKAQELEDIGLKEKELLFQIEEGERSALSDKRALMSVIEGLLHGDHEKNVHEMDLLFKFKYHKEAANSLEKKLKDSDAIIHSLTLNNNELNSALHMETLRGNEANSQLEETLQRLISISNELSTFAKLSNCSQAVVNTEPTDIECNVLNSENVLQNLTEVIAELKSFFVREIRGIIKEAEGLSTISVKMEEEISTMKIQFGNILRESDELKAERNEFQSHLDKERETIICLQDQLQSSNENRVALSHQVNGLLKQLKKTEGELVGLIESNKKAEFEILENALRFQELEEELQASEVVIATLAECDEENLVELKELTSQHEKLEEELQASEVVIANLAECDEENLVELKELTSQHEKLKGELFGANEQVKSLLAEIQNMKESSVPHEHMDYMKSEVQRLTSQCEILQKQLSEMKEVCVNIEEKNSQLVEEMTVVIDERDRVIAESEEVRSGISKGFNELLLVQETLKETKSELTNIAEENKVLALSLTTEKSNNDNVQGRIEKIVQENESLLKELEGMRQICSVESNHLEVITSLQKELEEVKFSLSVCAESEKELDDQLASEKKKIILLNDQLSNAATEKEKITLKCQQLQQSIDELENTLRLSEDETLKLVGEISQLTTLNEQLSQKLNESDEKFSEKEGSYITRENEFKSKMEEMEVNLIKKSAKIDLLSSKNSELNLLLDSKDDKMSELESKVIELNEALIIHINDVNAGKIRISELESDLVALQGRLNSETAHLREESEELVKEKLQEISLALQNAEEKLKLSSEEAAAEIENYKEVISKLQKRLEELVSEFNYISKQKDEKIESLEVEIEKFILKSQEMETILALKADIEAKLEDISSQKEKICLELEMTNERMMKMKYDTEECFESEKSNYEQRVADLQKQLQDASIEFEIILKEKDEKVNSLQHELQLEVEKFDKKSEEVDSLQSLKSDAEAQLNVVLAEKDKLLVELESAEKKIENLKNETAEELGVEMSRYEQNIASLQKQLQDASNEFEVIVKEKDEKVNSLQHELQLEVERFNQKSEEVDSLQLLKSDFDAQLNVVLAEKEKLLVELESAEKKIENLRNETVAEFEVERSRYEQNIEVLKNQLQDTNSEFELILKEKDEKMNSLRHELQLEIEKFNQKCEEADSLQLLKSDSDAQLNVVLAEKEKLLVELESAEKKMENLRNETAAEFDVERSRLEQNITVLEKQLQDASNEFEMILKEKDEKMNSLQHELQLEVEKFNQKCEEADSLQLLKSDSDAQLNVVLAEKEKLLVELESAEKKMENLRNETAAEFEVERSRLEQNITVLEKQLQDASNEFEMILREKDEKMNSLQHELQLEVEKFNQKCEEADSLQLLKSDSDAQLNVVLAEKEKLLVELESAEKKIENLRNETAAEFDVERSRLEQNITVLEKQLQDASNEFEMILKEKDEKMNSLRHELQLEVEKFNQKCEEADSLQSLKSDSDAQLNVVLAEKEKLLVELESAEKKMENLRNETAAEFEVERSRLEQNITVLEKQLQDASNEFEMILKEKDEKMNSLRHELQLEVEKFNQKCEEADSLQSLKSDSDAQLNVVLAEKEKLLIELESSEKKVEILKNETASEFEVERSRLEQNITVLEKQLQDASNEFEMILKEKDEKMNSLQSELQLEIEKFNKKNEEADTLILSRDEIEAKLVEISNEKILLTQELGKAEERMQKLKNDTESFISSEKSEFEKIIACLKGKLDDERKNFELVLKQKDENINSLENDIRIEAHKFNEKEKECMHVQFLKKELEMQIEHFAQEEQKYLATEKKLVAEELKTESLEKRLSDLNANYIANVEELNRLKCLEHDLKFDLEKIKNQSLELDSAHLCTKKDLSVAQSSNEKLQYEINVLKDKLQEVTNSREQLSVLLNIEKEGRLAARAAEEKTLEVLASQQKVISVFETSLSDLKEKLKSENENCNYLKVKCNDLESKLADTESSAHAELSCLREQYKMLEEEVKGLRVAHQQKPSEDMLNALKEKDHMFKVLEQKLEDAGKERTELETELARSKAECRTLETHLTQIEGQLKSLHDTINAKQGELNELQEKYNERDDYAKRMDQWAVKMEKRVTTADDFRIEIQQKAKAMEADLKLKINQLKTEKERLEHQKMKPEPVKCKCQQFEKDLIQEKEEKEALRQKVDEYKRMIACRGRYESTHSKKPDVSDSSVQTTSVEVVDIDPSGCGVVQVCKVDVLNQMVNKLKKEKEDLKQICRRRHNQREELKLQVEELKIKLQTVESQARKN